MTRHEGNPSLLFIFRLSSWLHWTLGEIFLRQPNTTCAEFKLAGAYVCMFNLLQPNRLASILVQVIRLDLASTWGQGLSRATSRLNSQLGFQLTWSSCFDVIPSPGMSSINLARSIMLIENKPICRSHDRDIPNIHPSSYIEALDHLVSMLVHL